MRAIEAARAGHRRVQDAIDEGSQPDAWDARRHLVAARLLGSVIDDEYELARAREYIRSNPANYRPRIYRAEAARERPRDDIVK